MEDEAQAAVALSPAQFQSNDWKLGRCRHGWMLWPKADDTIGRCLDLYGEFAEAENELMRNYVEPGDWVIDVGANLGSTVLPFSAAVGSSGQVVAFEPQPLLAQCLQTCLTLNNRLNVRVFTAAVGAASGWASMAIPSLGGSGVASTTNYGAVSLSDRGLRVPVMRLDDLELPRCALVKIDVEGFEWQVLQGAQATLQRLRPMLYFEAKKIPGTRHCLQWLMSQGWRCYWHFAFFVRPNNFKAKTENVFANVGDMNILALPADRSQPDHLPEIVSPDEDWGQTYVPFFTNLGKPVPQ